jgi:tRNA modification GTPase
MPDERLASVTTIAALATASSPAGIAIIRVSGPEAKVALKALFKSRHSPVAHPREMTFGELIDHKSGAVIDQALAVYMPGPHSYTGEDVAEFQFHGSQMLVQKMLRSLYAFGAVPAEPGEFTKRAFLNGKLDLIQAEAICDLIEASSEQALKIAGEHLHGRFSSAVEKIGEPLRDALADIEAGVDFPDEPVEPLKKDKLLRVFSKARTTIEELLRTYSFGQVVREGFRVLLCGRPNVGKSSLLNLLLGRQRAIVTDISGTTRDLIEENALLGGFKFVFCDSAGIIETDHKVEQIGVELAKDRIPWADVVLFVVDATDTTDSYKDVLSFLRGKAKKVWMVVNKIDLNADAFAKFFCDSTVCSENFYLSARTRDGFQSLVDALIAGVKTSVTDNAASSQVVTNERQRNCLLQADEALTQAEDVLRSGMPFEILSVELRTALRALEELVGKTYNDEILGRIFSKFCIGK